MPRNTYEPYISISLLGLPEQYPFPPNLILLFKPTLLLSKLKSPLLVLTPPPFWEVVLDFLGLNQNLALIRVGKKTTRCDIRGVSWIYVGWLVWPETDATCRCHVDATMPRVVATSMPRNVLMLPFLLVLPLFPCPRLHF